MKKEIAKIIKEKGQATPKIIKSELGLSLVTIHKYLKELQTDGSIEKIGQTPKIYYQFVKDVPEDYKIKSKIIEDNFIKKDPIGNLYTGTEAFALWSKSNLKKYTLKEKIKLYEQRIKELKSLKKDGVYVLDEKLQDFQKQTGEKIYLQEVVCAMPYTLPDFGKTKEAIFLGIAKDGREKDKKFIDQLIDLFTPPLLTYIRQRKIDAVAFIPPSATRKLQIMNIATKSFKEISDLPVIKIQKIHGQISQQQKFLSDIKERVTNANLSFLIPDYKERHTNVLLIDDLVGSGATINQIAKKLVETGIAKKVFGIGMIGIKKGFNVVKKT
ncbi:MAG: hypothetical protein OXU73_00010 [Candidatus Campbellbacteria bacterium]|nr:hypothetical protein [Candidatus Campbellbacteria bacterium]